VRCGLSVSNAMVLPYPHGDPCHREGVESVWRNEINALRRLAIWGPVPWYGGIGHPLLTTQSFKCMILATRYCRR
jgi:hypothetical protein